MTVRIIRGQGVDACPPGHWALYDDVEFNRKGPADILIGDASAGNLGEVGFDGRASSYVNRTGRTISLYDDAGYGGRRIDVLPGRAERLVVDQRTVRPYVYSNEEVGDMNDAVSSVEVREPGPETARLLPEAGTYTLVNVYSGKALDVLSDGSVLQWTGHGGPNQRWTLTPVGYGLYTLTSVFSGKVLDVTGASRHNGARVQQWTGNGTAAQRWRVTEAGGGVYRLQCVGSDKYLDVQDGRTDDGAPVHQWEHDDSDSQKWRLSPLG
ncbi:RICIN domain-containing protein [Kitasatospora sp. NPDC089509]|uniref:RICIN domain-containing protein n=1 Tax=Kitasatospora sp. NPDC089509 TaxID=3364079 RepID=UPI00380609E3